MIVHPPSICTYVCVHACVCVCVCCVCMCQDVCMHWCVFVYLYEQVGSASVMYVSVIKLRQTLVTPAAHWAKQVIIKKKRKKVSSSYPNSFTHTHTHTHTRLLTNSPTTRIPHTLPVTACKSGTKNKSKQRIGEAWPADSAIQCLVKIGSAQNGWLLALSPSLSFSRPASSSAHLLAHLSKATQ